MSASRFLGLIATVVVSGATGWVLNEQWRATGEKTAPPVAEFRASRSPSPSSPSPSPTPESGSAQVQPPVTLFSDGTVTVNVQKRPLQWLLDEITRQGGLQVSAPEAPVQDSPARPALNEPEFAVCKGSSASESKACEVEQAQQTLRAISEGDEKARYEALLMARTVGLSVPQETLKTLYETDTSERVRLLAFAQYIDVTQETGRDETHAALQAALYSPSQAIQTEAKRLLHELEESEAEE